MGLNHILYRPQVLTQAVSKPEERIAEELMELVSRLVADAIKGGRAKDKFLEGLQEAFETMAQDFKSRINQASQSMAEFMGPIMAMAQALGGSMGNMMSPMDGIKALAKII